MFESCQKIALGMCGLFCGGWEQNKCYVLYNLVGHGQRHLQVCVGVCICVWTQMLFLTLGKPTPVFVETCVVCFIAGCGLGLERG